MRKVHLLLVSALATPAWSTSARAQVSEAERAAARELFRQGDELQRASKFADALDKFQRAQQVFGAPTNLLRIAECDAALGRLVESSEAYRAVLRTPLAGGTAPAFQAAVDQARAELEQVAPRVPRLVVEVQAPAAANLQLQIDGQGVPAALIGEPVPLDPGPHKVFVGAPGFTSSEQQVELKEKETRTVSFALTAIPGVVAGPEGAPGAPPVVPAAVSPPAAPAAPSGAVAMPEAPAPKASRSLLLGAHLGLEIAAGKLPDAVTGTGTTGTIDVSSVGSAGLALGLDVGVRFARQWVLTATLDHAQLGGANPSKLSSTVKGANANTSLLALVLGLIANPERPSFYGELGVGYRWLGYSENHTTEHGYTAGEVTVGAGAWLPLGNAWRVVPKVTGGFGAFSPPGSSGATSSQGYAFFLLGASGYFNTDL